MKQAFHKVCCLCAVFTILLTAGCTSTTQQSSADNTPAVPPPNATDKQTEAINAVRSNPQMTPEQKSEMEQQMLKMGKKQ